MEQLVFTPTYEIFLILEAFRDGFPELVSVLRPLSGAQGGRVLGVDGYYRPSTDIALLGLRFDERELTANRLTALLDFAAGNGIAVLDPARLAEPDRRAFYDRYLPEYPIRAEDLARPHQALVALGMKLGLVLGDGSTRADPSRGDPDGWPAEGSSSSAVDPEAEALARDWFAGDGSPGPPRAPRRGDRATAQLDAELLRPYLEDTDGAAGSRPRPIVATPGDTWRRRCIFARYRRGEDWAPARLRSLGLKGAYLATGAPPPLGDVVELAIGLGQIGAVLPARVVHVTTPEDAVESGAAGFGVHFSQEDSRGRQQLTTILKLAHAHGIALKPPPPRRFVRYPVRWPVRLVAPATRLAAAATDVSQRGLFVATMEALGPSGLHFGLPLDDGGPPIRGRARIARAVTSEMAGTRGIQPGFGLEILELNQTDGDRYEHFVRRVRRRVERRVMVAAPGERGIDLVAGLTAAGYAAFAATDLRQILDYTEAMARPPDAAVIDATMLLPPIAGRRLEQALSQRQVPWITVQGETAGRTRASVDQLLDVA